MGLLRHYVSFFFANIRNILFTIVILSFIFFLLLYFKFLLLNLSKFESMEIDFKIKLNAGLYLKNPEHTEIGKAIIANSISMINQLGYENFTFKKLATQIPTTEATVYRYFENKHKLLIYLVDWYWSFLRYQILFKLNNITDPEEKIRKCIDLLVWEDNEDISSNEFDIKSLYYISIAEGSKTYLAKEVDELNKEQLFVPYKELCGLLASIFLEYNPKYKFANSLASTLVEASHFQYYFMNHLPRLCDFSEDKNAKTIEDFLSHMVLSTLK
jgi:AcrR family transcriptional regulator